MAKNETRQFPSIFFQKAAAFCTYNYILFKVCKNSFKIFDKDFHK